MCLHNTGIFYSLRPLHPCPHMLPTLGTAILYWGRGLPTPVSLHFLNQSHPLPTPSCPQQTFCSSCVSAASRVPFGHPWLHCHLLTHFLPIISSSFFYLAQCVHPASVSLMSELCVILSSLIWIISAASLYTVLSPLLLSSLHLPHCSRRAFRKLRHN